MRRSRSSSVANITSMPQTAEEERTVRVRNYAIAMGIRTACFLCLIWVRGPWMLLFAAGAIFLPYFAVVIANQVRRKGADAVARPAAVQIIIPASPDGEAPRCPDAGAGRPGDEARRDWEAA